MGGFGAFGVLGLFGIEPVGAGAFGARGAFAVVGAGAPGATGAACSAGTAGTAGTTGLAGELATVEDVPPRTRPTAVEHSRFVPLTPSRGSLTAMDADRTLHPRIGDAWLVSVKALGTLSARMWQVNWV